MSHGGHTAALADLLADAYGRFDRQGAPIQVLDIASTRCIGVQNEQKDNVDFDHLRRIFCEKPESESSLQSIVQIVGDSGTAFDSASILAAQEALAEQLECSVLIEYGFTSIKHDANWLVQDYISSRREAAVHTIANIVSQSVVALQSADWRGSEHVRIFVVLYNNDGTATKFGEDTWLSDGVMASEVGDRMLCFEGGPQAFHQCVNALTKGIEVLVMTNLRPMDQKKRFSAARLLLVFMASANSTDFEQSLDDCLHTAPPTKEEQLINICNDLDRLKLCGNVSKLISRM